MQFDVQFYNILSKLHASTVSIKIFISYIHEKKMVEKKSQEVDCVAISLKVLGSNTVADQTHTHSSQQQLNSSVIFVNN